MEAPTEVDGSFHRLGASVEARYTPPLASYFHVWKYSSTRFHSGSSSDFHGNFDFFHCRFRGTGGTLRRAVLPQEIVDVPCVGQFYHAILRFRSSRTRSSLQDVFWLVLSRQTKSRDQKRSLAPPLASHVQSRLCYREVLS